MANIKDSKSISDSREILSTFDVRTNPFIQNVSGDHAYKRTERIVSAIYLVTNHVRYEEPLRERIRSIGHDLLTQVLALRIGFRSVGSDHVNKLIANIRELASYVQLLSIGGHLSRQNAGILVQAIDDLGQFIASSQRSILSEEFALSREDFLPQATAREIGRQKRTREASDTLGGSDDSPREAGQQKASGDKTSKGHKGHQKSYPKRQVKLHNERQHLILDILRNGGALAIRDITSNMVDCGEKTVQRELNFLVRDGKVRKEGEKRWSRYKLTVTE